MASRIAAPTGTVEVLNGTSTEGVAKQIADTLSARGLRVARYGNADRPHLETVVEARPGARQMGLDVAAILGLRREVVTAPNLPDGLDLRVTLGEMGTSRSPN